MAKEDVVSKEIVSIRRASLSVACRGSFNEILKPSNVGAALVSYGTLGIAAGAGLKTTKALIRRARDAGVIKTFSQSGRADLIVWCDSLG